MYDCCREDRKDEDFRLLVTTVLQYPAQDPLEAVGDVLCLVPQDFSGDIPELEEAIFDVRGLSGVTRWFYFFSLRVCVCVYVCSSPLFCINRSIFSSTR